MIHSAIKKYLHSSFITENEVNLVKELLKDGGEELKDFLPKEKKANGLFLSKLLQASLKDYKNNKDFINTILTLKNDDNKDSLYYDLKNHKYGLEIIKNNPTLFNDDLNEVFNDLLNNGSSKPILEFVKNNREKIELDNIYKHCLDIGVVQSLEKLGLQFDDRIIDVVVNEKNYRKSDKLLNYIEKFENNCKEEIWNPSIIRMLRYYNRQHWDDYGKYKFIDSFGLINKLKNPTQYTWGQEFKGWDYFSFPDAFRSFVNGRGFSGYLDQKNPIELQTVKEFIQKNDIHFNNIKGHELVFAVFLDDFSNDVVEKAIKNSWSGMFRFKEQPNAKRTIRLYDDKPIFDDLRKENSILGNERFRRIAIKEYFSNKKYRLESYSEDTFFTALGLGKNDIIHNSALSKYSDILNKENVIYILDSLRLGEKSREVALMNYEMQKPDDFTETKNKKFKI